MYKLIVASICCVVLLSASTVAQEDELELMDTVAKLQTQLNSPKENERDDAEAQLLKLGTDVLNHLESATDDSTTDYRERVNRIRKTLETNVVNQASQASKVTLKGKMTVGVALKKLKQQTQNNVDLADPSYADIPIEIDVKDVEFWPTINKIMKQADLIVDPYGGSKPEQLVLTASESESKNETPTSTSKIFQTQVTRVSASVNLQNPDADYSTISLLVRWEPRLRPISVDIPMSSVTIIDEYEDSLPLSNPQEIVYGMVQPELPQVEFTLQLPRVDRQIELLKSLTATIDSLLPGKSEQFRFNKISKLKPGFSIEKAGAKVTFGGTKKNEDVYSVQMSISFEEENNALESHQGWVYQNEVYLIDGQGKREEAISLETLRQDNEKVTVQYYFLNEPGARTLVYNTPASIVKLPVKIDLKNIPLP